MPETATSEPAKEKNLCKGMNLSFYPNERAEIIRIMSVKKLRAPNDVIRLALRRARLCKPTEINPPRTRA